MKGYKLLKSKSKVAVKKIKVIDQEAVKEITDEKGNVVRAAEAEKSHEELQLVSKRFDSNTGEALDDSKQIVSVSDLESNVKRLKEEKANVVSRVDAEVADLEELIADLKKL
tara:strand:+ start:243 stop:578 length:336 start_codon:yes stop_codon:yes gene_type:complete